MLKKKPNTRKDRRKDESDTDPPTSTVTPPLSTTSPISGRPVAIESKRDKRIGASPSTVSVVLPGRGSVRDTSEPSADTKAFKDDPAAFLESNYVSFSGINWGSLPSAKSDLLFQLNPQLQDPGFDQKEEDLFVVTRDPRYVLDVDVSPPNIKPQYDGTKLLVLAIRDTGPDTGVRFLRWEANKLTAMFLDEDATWVVTGPLQGCHVYVAELAGGGAVLLHANANDTLDEDRNMQIKDNKAETFLAPMKGQITHRLVRKDYAPSREFAYNGFVFGQKNPDQTWSFFSYVIHLNMDGIALRRLAPLPPVEPTFE